MDFSPYRYRNPWKMGLLMVIKTLLLYSKLFKKFRTINTHTHTYTHTHIYYTE